MQVLPFPNNPKDLDPSYKMDLDPSYKMDLDFWDCFGRNKIPSYNRRNRVLTVSINTTRKITKDHSMDGHTAPSTAAMDTFH